MRLFGFLDLLRFSVSFLLELNILSKTKYNWRYERNIGLGMQAEDAAVVAFGLDGDGLEQLDGDFSFEWNIFNTLSKNFEISYYAVNFSSLFPRSEK